MSAIPKSLRDAFNAAISEARDWFWNKGDAEPEVLLHRQSYRVSEICTMIERSSAPIPMAEGAMIDQLARELHCTRPADPSYGAHARSLGEIWRHFNEERTKELKEQRDAASSGAC